MTGAFIILLATVVTGVVLYVRHRYEMRKKSDSNEVEEIVRPEGCCGMHEVCEKDSLLSGVSGSIEYYEDEELDDYKGMQADEYTEEQIEQFRDVLYTLRREEVAGWARSIQLREITLPSIIQDELLMIISEMRDGGLNVQLR